jgi:hypothetical protein
MRVPIVYLMFNRPDLARQTFEKIRLYRPNRLYLIADGPRSTVRGEDRLCAETKNVVESLIDWNCEVKKNYAQENMGCGRRTISGLNWVFEHEEQALFIEEDVLVDATLFDYCETLLDRYRDSPQVMSITGHNRINYTPPSGSYFFAGHGSTWGMATWRRTWRQFCAMDQCAWIRIKDENQYAPKCISKREAVLRSKVIDEMFDGVTNVWSARWGLTLTMNDGLVAIPAKNMVRNIGYSLRATNTINPFNRDNRSRMQSLLPPYIEPNQIAIDRAFEKKYCEIYFSRYVVFRTWLWQYLRHIHSRIVVR